MHNQRGDLQAQHHWQGGLVDACATDDAPAHCSVAMWWVTVQHHRHDAMFRLMLMMHTVRVAAWPSAAGRNNVTGTVIRAQGEVAPALRHHGAHG